MTRILYWNIENFDDDTIDPTTPRGANRRDVILQHIRQFHDPTTGVLLRDSPDIFAVVEVGNRIFGDRRAGEVMDPGHPSALAVNQLLAAIQTDPNIRNNANWCLIPPIVSGVDGYREGIAIFYDSTHLIFTGPNIYAPAAPVPGTTRTGLSVALGAGVAGNYPGAFVTTLPIATPGAAAITAGIAPLPAAIATTGVPQNQLAGQWRFVDAANNQLFFPANGIDPTGIPGGPIAPIPIPAAPVVGGPASRRGTAAGDNDKERSPFLVTFWDTIAPGGGREIQLLVYHSSPSSAVAGTTMLGYIRELQPPAYQQVSVITGDFNVDVTSTTRANFAYALLTGAPLGYTKQLNKPLPIPPAATITELQKSYVYTMIYAVKRKNKRDEEKPGVKQYPLPYSAGYPSDNYPLYDGFTSKYYQILVRNADNVFIRYTLPPAPPGPNNTTIVNLITGTPYAHPQVQNNYITGITGTTPPLPPIPRPLNAVTPLNGYATFSPPVATTPASVLRDRRLTPPPAGFPLGGIPYLSAFFPFEPLLPVCPPTGPPGFNAQILLPRILNGMYFKNDSGRNSIFKDDNLYFKIQDTSDHLAIVTDV